MNETVVTTIIMMVRINNSENDHSNITTHYWRCHNNNTDKN